MSTEHSAPEGEEAGLATEKSELTPEQQDVAFEIYADNVSASWEQCVERAKVYVSAQTVTGDGPSTSTTCTPANAGYVMDFDGRPTDFARADAIAELVAENERLRDQNDRLQSAITILHEAMVEKKPIPMRFKHAILDAAKVLPRAAINAEKPAATP